RASGPLWGRRLRRDFEVTDVQYPKILLIPKLCLGNSDTESKSANFHNNQIVSPRKLLLISAMVRIAHPARLVT
ncbi:MAG TPA: hypothetical protein DCZ48_05615, partial [Methylococcaceae bacterium]|nr:hypothetical protein [Methylococcaceae bacterium]